VIVQRWLCFSILEAQISGTCFLRISEVAYLLIAYRVIPPGGLGSYNDTGIPLSLKYGDGSYGVSGTIVIAPFELGSYRVEKQGLPFHPVLGIPSNIGLITSIPARRPSTSCHRFRIITL
jgi:hypothetical protein